MKIKLNRWQNWCLTKLLTVMGFAAPITLASCYGPVPTNYTPDEEGLIDSAYYEEETDSTLVLVEDTTEAV
ncbi:MAG: hypothetical protein IJP82_08030 [Bacteroidaceae bacterium]|nr:hypothetical protein [Bacteroidaceae bacterium]